MSEKLNSPENPFIVKPESGEEDKSSPENTHEKVELSPEKDDAQIDEAREKIEQLEDQGAEQLKHALDAGTKDEAETIYPAGDQAKSVTLSTNLSIIRSSLGKTSRSFSGFIHKPSVNAVSEASGKTILRPSALLSGAIFTFIGSLYYLLVSNAAGYKYNFFVALALFVGGFIVGLILEFIYRLAFSR